MLKSSTNNKKGEIAANLAIQSAIALASIVIVIPQLLEKGRELGTKMHAVLMILRKKTSEKPSSPLIHKQIIFLFTVKLTIN
ncbi:hypothetical protein ACSBR2_016001 [Camellia fascicularis]